MAAEPKPGKYLKLAQPSERRLSIVHERMRNGALTAQQQKVVENTTTTLIVAEGKAMIEAHTMQRTQQVFRYAAREQYETRSVYDRIRQLPLSPEGKRDMDVFLRDLDELGGNVILGMLADFGDDMREIARTDIRANERQPHVVYEEQEVKVGLRDAIRGHKKVMTQRVEYDE